MIFSQAIFVVLYIYPYLLNTYAELANIILGTELLIQASRTLTVPFIFTLIAL